MKTKRAAALGAAVLLASVMVDCGRAPRSKDIEIRRFSLDTLEGVIQGTGVEIDKHVKAEGAGSLKVTVGEPSIIRLFETGPLDIEEATLVYRAKLRTENALGNVYLEMWCHLPGKGEFFSRGLASPLRGTNDWSTQETPFFLKKGEKPDNVKLNIVSEGPGVVWIDDIRLLRRALPPT